MNMSRRDALYAALAAGTTALPGAASGRSHVGRVGPARSTIADTRRRPIVTMCIR